VQSRAGRATWCGGSSTLNEGTAGAAASSAKLAFMMSQRSLISALSVTIVLVPEHAGQRGPRRSAPETFIGLSVSRCAVFPERGVFQGAAGQLFPDHTG